MEVGYLFSMLHLYAYLFCYKCNYCIMGMNTMVQLYNLTSIVLNTNTEKKLLYYRYVYSSNLIIKKKKLTSLTLNTLYIDAVGI